MANMINTQIGGATNFGTKSTTRKREWFELSEKEEAYIMGMKDPEQIRRFGIMISYNGIRALQETTPPESRSHAGWTAPGYTTPHCGYSAKLLSLR